MSAINARQRLTDLKLARAVAQVRERFAAGEFARRDADLNRCPRTQRQFCAREELEQRLALHTATAGTLCRLAMGDASQGVAADLGQLVRWLAGDAERIVLDLFAPISMPPPAGLSRRQSEPAVAAPEAKP